MYLERRRSVCEAKGGIRKHSSCFLAASKSSFPDVIASSSAAMAHWKMNRIVKASLHGRSLWEKLKLSICLNRLFVTASLRKAPRHTHRVVDILRHERQEITRRRGRRSDHHEHLPATTCAKSNHFSPARLSLAILRTVCAFQGLGPTTTISSVSSSVAQIAAPRQPARASRRCPGIRALYQNAQDRGRPHAAPNWLRSADQFSSGLGNKQVRAMLCREACPSDSCATA